MSSSEHAIPSLAGTPSLLKRLSLFDWLWAVVVVAGTLYTWNRFDALMDDYERVLLDRRHTRLISEFGGLKHVAPKLVAAFFVITLSSIGLPGLNGFIGEFLVLLGAFRAEKWWAVLASTGVILSGVYMLWMFQRVVFGPVTHDENKNLTDLTIRERLVFAPILILIVWMGVTPQPFLDRMQPALDRTLALIEQRTEMTLRLDEAGGGVGRIVTREGRQ